jgi:hypothetical protein
MESTLAPMEAVAVPGRISGTGVIDDLCRRIAEKLALFCDLRAIDAYAGYAAKVEITLQLVDVYPSKSPPKWKWAELIRNCHPHISASALRCRQRRRSLRLWSALSTPLALRKLR